MTTKEINYLGDLKNVLSDLEIDPDDICIVGSAVLSAYGIRKNNDIEFICVPNCAEVIKKKYQLKNKVMIDYHMTDRTDYFYNMLGLCGIREDTVFSERLYKKIDGWNVLDLEIEYLYKKSLIPIMHREKDKKDIYYLQENFPEIVENSKSYKRKYCSNLYRIFCNFCYLFNAAISIIRYKLKR